MTLFVKLFLVEQQITVLENPSTLLTWLHGAPLYSPNLAPDDFFLVSKTENSIERNSSCISRRDPGNRNQFLKQLSENDFQGCEYSKGFEQCWQACIDSQGAYSEGNH